MRSTRFGTGVGLSLGAVLAAPAAAQAEDIRVTNLNPDGPGSLRQAMLDANFADLDADRVVFKSKLSGEINLPDEGFSSPLFIGWGDVEVVGPGARKVTVNAAPGHTIFFPYTFYVTSLDVAISGLTLSGGHRDDSGGAIRSGSNAGPTDLTLSDVTITGNSADDNGGGVYAYTDQGDGSLVIENSTITGNTAGISGGGIATDDVDVSIRSSTISGNVAGTEGGGAFLGGLSNPSIEVRNSTVTGNEAQGGDGGGGLYESGGGAKTLRGTIVAGNTHDNAPDLDDGPWSTSFSLIGDTSGAGITDQGGNILEVSPKLKALRNNGGPTDTHGFKKSPAKNKGPSDAPNADQRGAPRKGKADIGAYELVKCEGVIVNRVGTAGKDKLKGTKRKDGILGLGGNDKLSGKKGKDGLCGGSGKDKLKGGPGKDKLDGGPGKDREVQ